MGQAVSQAVALSGPSCRATACLLASWVRASLACAGQLGAPSSASGALALLCLGPAEPGVP